MIDGSINSSETKIGLFLEVANKKFRHSNNFLLINYSIYLLQTHKMCLQNNEFASKLFFQAHFHEPHMNLISLGMARRTLAWQKHRFWVIQAVFECTHPTVGTCRHSHEIKNLTQNRDSRVPLAAQKNFGKLPLENPKPEEVSKNQSSPDTIARGASYPVAGQARQAEPVITLFLLDFDLCRKNGSQVSSTGLSTVDEAKVDAPRVWDKEKVLHSYIFHFQIAAKMLNIG